MKIRLVNKLFWALSLGAFFCLDFSVLAGEIASDAGLIESGTKFFSIVGVQAETKPTLKLSSNGSIQVPVSGGFQSVFASGNADVEMEQHSSAGLAILKYRPGESLEYKFKFGQIRSFDLEFSSGMQVNKLEATREGIVWGFGVSGQISPGSIVSTAINWELGYSQTKVFLDRFKGGDVVYSSAQQWRQEEIQGSIGLSYRWKMLEPYGGVKLRRVINKLSDAETKSILVGKNDEYSPYVGLALMLGPKESLILESSFLDEKSVVAGFNYQF